MPTHTFSSPDFLSMTVTALPGFLGYHPNHKVILDFGPSGPTLVKALPDSREEFEHEIVSIMQRYPRSRPEANLIVLSEGWPGIPQIDADSLRRRVSAVGGCLPVIAGTDRISGGGVLTTPEGEVECTLGDPTSSPSARLLYRSGEIISADENEMLGRLRPGPFDDVGLAADIQSRVEEEGRWIDEYENGFGDALDRRRSWFRDWAALIDRLVVGKESVSSIMKEEENLRALARIYCDNTVRDMILRDIVDPGKADSVRTMLLHASRCFSGVYRASALATYAVDRLANNCEPLAAAALGEAAREVPDHSLTNILQSVCRDGHGAASIRILVDASDEVAEVILGTG